MASERHNNTENTAEGAYPSKEKSRGSPEVVMENVSQFFSSDSGERVVALSDISFTVKHNEFLCLVGRSGCGKTTLLNLVAGFLRPSEGQVLVQDQPVKGPGPDRGMVFQHSALFPWQTAIKNIEFGPSVQKVSKAERRTQAQELIELVGLQGFEDSYPKQLSGGMQQRVAIARALALDPEILLMDEPFGALDEITRTEMQQELLRIWESKRKTVIFVTHDITEAIFLADRILVLSPHPGRLRKELSIDLPRPRERSSDEFMSRSDEILQTIL